MTFSCCDALSMTGAALRPTVPRVERHRSGKESRARLLGVGVALLAMVVASLTIRWPAPGVSAGLGLAVYLLARR